MNKVNKLLKKITLPPHLISSNVERDMDGKLWNINHGTNTNELGTYAEFKAKAGKGNRFEITGNYSPNQCVKYSDLVVTKENYPMKVDAKCSNIMTPQTTLTATFTITCTDPSDASWVCKVTFDSSDKYFVALDTNNNSVRSGTGSSKFNIYLKRGSGTVLSGYTVIVDFTYTGYATNRLRVPCANTFGS